MSFTMPDVRNLTEAAARDAILALTDNPDESITLDPQSGLGYDDHDTLGAASGNLTTGLTADTVGADGTISAQFPAPGTTVISSMGLIFDVWGVDVGDLDPFFDGTELQTSITLWAQSSATTAYGYTPAAPPDEEPTSGPWTEADWAAGSSFRVEITTLHRPSAPAEALTVTYDPDDPLHQPYAASVVSGELVAVTQFADISVKETLNDQTELSFTMSLYDPMVQHVINPPTYLPDIPVGYVGNGAYTFACRVYYRNQIQPCFWAPCTFSINFDAGTVTVTGVDVIRLQHHYLRVGDPILDHRSDNGLLDTGFARIDTSGILNVLIAAFNTDEQDTRDVPSLGMNLAYASSTDQTARIGVERSQGVWDVLQEITSHEIGPDWWLEPRNDDAGYYARVRTFDKRGSDRTATVRWFYGVTDPTDNPDAVDNVSAVTATPMIPVTHAHVVASDATELRETVGDADESYMRGIFVDWIAQDGNTKGKAEAVVRAGLHAVAGAHVNAYANAPAQVDITLRPDAAQDAFWREQFWPGDTAFFHAAKGYGELSGDLRIQSVEVGEQGWRGVTTTKVTVVPDKTRDDLGGEA